MESFWDYSVWGTLNVVAALLAALLGANIIKKSIQPLQASLIPTSVLGGLLLLVISAVYNSITDSNYHSANKCFIYCVMHFHFFKFGSFYKFFDN